MGLSWYAFGVGILYGIVEGITEWLPVSSTGHLILLRAFLPLPESGMSANTAEEFWQMYEVVIQLGAILSVLCLYFHRLNPFSAQKSAMQKKQTFRLWRMLLLASVPAAVVGIGADLLTNALTGKDFETLLYRPVTVAATLIAYGILYMIVEKQHKSKADVYFDVSAVSRRQAFTIGAFQALAVIPGTSRSGSTILGGLWNGLPGTAASEFSFFLAIPAMMGGSAVKALGFLRFWIAEDAMIPVSAWLLLAVSFLTAFLFSLAAIRFLLAAVRKHGFFRFGVYRVALGCVLIVLLSTGLLPV